MAYQSKLLAIISRHPPERVVLSDDQNIRLTMAEMLQAIQDVIREFRKHEISGLAVLMDNSPAQVIVSLAALEEGIWILPIPPFFTQSQTHNALSQAGCSNLLTEYGAQPSQNCAHISVAGRQLLLSSTDLYQQDRTRKGTALVTFTSGSTGAPKGLCLSEQHILATVAAVSHSMNSLGIRKHMSVLPLSVLLESVAGVYAGLYSGVECVVPTLGRIGMAAKPAPDFVRLMSHLLQHRINSCILVPELLNGLVQLQSEQTQDISCLRFIAVGGGRVDPELLKSAKHLALPVYEGYGLSEAGSVVSLNVPGQRIQGSAGRLLSHQGVNVSSNGEILLSKPAFLGYCGSLQEPEVPFPTGDIGHVDSDGYLWIQGRQKNMLITSMGRNVSPEWVESSLTTNGMIKQAFVYGDGQLKLSALIVSDHPSQLATFIDEVNCSLPDYAQIAHWQVVAPFTIDDETLTGTGKLCRHVIASRYCLKQKISLIA